MFGLGRTKAYAMAKRFRDTDGREGMPNVDFWGSPRVPVWALKKLVDDALTPKPATGPVAAETADSAPDCDDLSPTIEPTPLEKPKRTRRNQPRDDQSALFILDAAGDEQHRIPLPGRGAMPVPTIADVDGDGTLEIVVSLKGGEDRMPMVLVYNVPGSARNCMPWPTGRGNLLRNGYFRAAN